MPKSIKVILLFVLPAVALMFLMAGCKKKDVYPSQQLPKLTAISPTAAMVGDTVVLKGSNLQHVTDVKFGTRDVTNFAGSITDSAIAVIVPDSLAPGDLFVQVYLDNGAGYAAMKFKVLATPKVPAISSVSPVTAFPGDAIVIKGINFTNVSAVTFGSLSADFTVNDSTKITATVPLNVSGVNQVITVSAPTGSDTISFTVNFSPVITGLSPGQGVAGDSITVTGTRFTGATSVMLGAAAAGFVVYNDSTLKFAIPNGASSAPVTVTTPNGSGTSASSLTVLVAGLAFPIYDDAVTTNWTGAPSNGWIGGGWGGTVDYANTSPVESGTHSVRIDYVGGWGSPMQLGGANIDLTPFTSFKISIYGGPGSNGLQINLGINQVDSKTITVVEGQWTDYQFAITDLTSATTLTDIWVKEYNGTGGFTIYVDNMGLN